MCSCGGGPPCAAVQVGLAFAGVLAFSVAGLLAAIL